jgi:hypothetical protein
MAGTSEWGRHTKAETAGQQKSFAAFFLPQEVVAVSPWSTVFPAADSKNAIHSHNRANSKA